MTSNPTCVCCGQPMADSAYACVRCGITKPAEQLRQLSDMVPAARDVAHGLSRRGGGGASGKPGSRLPIDLSATSKLDAVERELGTWMRHVAEERGTVYGLAPDADPIQAACIFLGNRLEWFRHRAEVDEFLTDVQACARVVAGVARGPAAQRYLGPCGAEIATAVGVDGFVLLSRECDGDIYAREGASVGSCRLCGAQVSTDARRAWLDAEVRSRAFRAAEIAAAYGINVKTIRSWATDRPARYDHSGTQTQAARPAKLHPHGWDRDSRPLFLIGEVLDLAAADAARREEARADRARRATARETAEMGA